MTVPGGVQTEHHQHYPQVAAAQKPASGNATVWTCPMHPEIRRNAPGHCPICGMALEPLLPDTEDRSELTAMSRRFWMATILTLPLLVLAMGDMLPGAPISSLVTAQGRALLELILASPVCLWAAWPFYVRGWDSVVLSRSRRARSGFFLSRSGERNPDTPGPGPGPQGPQSNEFSHSKTSGPPRFSQVIVTSGHSEAEFLTLVIFWVSSKRAN
ncbi:MAG TPA: heavy metal-binding domain-containing protein [Oligoflexus sp.]|uniref:heavy metal-binding domain-containing protein n=1 Tax=Oligoflexus sp. TaxID=1971216 RepID=UPI002D804FC3|nr:heavy metal-binding domain-containing protein [Oligoflexus sp.]HET9239909.1 heavy metal-binding domain-containing protein [Oligoflexus sp.]